MKTCLLALAVTGALSAPALAAPRPSFGVQGQLLPVGDATLADDFESSTFDFDVAFGIAGQLDVDLGPNLSIGAAPRLIFNIDPEDAVNEADGWTQLDLAARATAHGRLPDSNTSLYGFLSPGYSFVFLPRLFHERDVRFDNPSGFVLGIGGGFVVDVDPSLSIVAEAGYTWGFQSTTATDGTTSDSVGWETEFLHLGVGVRRRI
jgi:hypothetical protein